MEEDCTIGTYLMFSFGSTCSSPYGVNININGKPLNMEIDIGASLSVMIEKMYQELWGEGGQPSLVKKLYRGGSETKRVSRSYGII